MFRVLLAIVLQANDPNTSTSGSLIPEWVFDPAAKIKEVLIDLLLGGLETVITFVVGKLADVRDAVRSDLGSAGAAIYGAFETAGSAIIGVEETIASMIADLGVGSGLAAPIAIVLTVTIVLAISAVGIKLGKLAVKRVLVSG